MIGGCSALSSCNPPLAALSPGSLVAGVCSSEPTCATVLDGNGVRACSYPLWACSGEYVCASAGVQHFQEEQGHL
eukprot:4456836-Alexandrium_andersonii.AAC.1